MRRFFNVCTGLVLCAAIPSIALAAPVRRGGDANTSKTTQHPAGSTGFGLSKFSVKSTTGNKQFRKLGTLLGLGHVTGFWNGKFELDQVHNALPGGHVRTAHRQRCKKTCTVTIDRAQPDQALVLSGFQFEVTDGRRHTISRIGILPNAKSGELTAVFEGATEFEFDVVVQYAFVPRDAVIESKGRGKRNDGTGRRTRINFPELAAAKGATFIRSFALAFESGAHTVEHLAIHAVREDVVVKFDPVGGAKYIANIGLTRARKADSN